MKLKNKLILIKLIEKQIINKQERLTGIKCQYQLML